MYFGRFFAQPGGIAGAEVDLEARAFEVVDEERSGDGDHGAQGTRME